MEIIKHISVSNIERETWETFKIIADFKGSSGSKLIREFMEKSITDSKIDKELSRFINIRKGLYE